MFKNNKDKENNFISTEEVEKIYDYQKKAFDGKIAEQQSQIDQLTNYISARFGENIANSNMATKLNDIEKELHRIQNSYKTTLEKTTKELRKQIENESKKIATELSDSQTEAYFKLLQKNENDLAKIKQFVGERKDNDNKVLELEKTVNDYIQSNEIYQKEVKQELKETNQKIGKINYLGISSKFDKKLKEECNKIEDKIEETKEKTAEEIIKNSESMAIIIGNLDERLSEEIVVTEEHLANTTSLVNSLDQKISKEITSVNEKIENATQLVTSLDEKVTSELTSVNLKTEDAVKVVENLEKRLSKELTTANKKVEKTTELVSSIDEKFSRELTLANEKMECSTQFINGIDEKISKELISVNEKLESTIKLVDSLDENSSNRLIDVDKKIENIENSISNLEKNVSKEILDLNTKVEDFTKTVTSLEDKILNTEKIAKSAKERITKESEAINKNLQEVENKLGILDKRLSEEIQTVGTNILAVENRTQSIKDNTTSKFVAIDEALQKNQIAIDKLEESMLKGFERSKHEAKDSINMLEESSKEKTAKIEEKIKQVKADIKTIQKEAKTIETNWTAKLGEIQQETNVLYTKIQAETDEKINTKMQETITNLENAKKQNTQLSDKFNSELKKIIKSSEEESKKIKDELNERLVNTNNENKTELQNIASTVDILKNTMESSFENISQEVLKLKDEAKVNLEKQEGNVTDTELLKKDYNKFVTKMNNELAKISKAILNAQKKNLETNQNLQVKIKAYIDSKIEKADNTQRVEELISKLNLSMQEREKLQKIEMEEKLNKKLKAIQRENERILNKKIEELSSKIIRENNLYTRTSPNNVTIYKEAPKKKNMYDLIDENQILKRSAASKKAITTSQEGKSQILKFFYDEEE